MNMISASAVASATAPLPAARDAETAASVFTAAGLLLPHLERGQRVDAATLRGAMEAAFRASDASGAWTWKTAYDACEAATVLFLRKYGTALFRKAGSTTAMPMPSPSSTTISMPRCRPPTSPAAMAAPAH